MKYRTQEGKKKMEKSEIENQKDQFLNPLFIFYYYPRHKWRIQEEKIQIWIRIRTENVINNSATL